MKLILESWRKFLHEGAASYRDKLEYDDEGNVILYHVSGREDIEELDPQLAAKNLRSYTAQEYKTWDRPRIFFFTRLGQEDVGIGRIEGTPYSVKIDPSQLYPINEDPHNLFSLRELQNYMAKESNEFAAEYEKAEKCNPSQEYNEWHICNKTSDSSGLAWIKDRFGTKRLLVNDLKYHNIKPNVYEMVANVAEMSYNSIGFIYPQSDDPNSLIVVLWKKVPATKLEKEFY